MDYLCLRVGQFLVYDKVYVLKIDIGQNKLKQMNDQSSLDVPLHENKVSKFKIKLLIGSSKIL